VLAADNCGDFCVNSEADYPSWEYPGIGRSLVFMALQGIVFLFILYILESDSCFRAAHPLSDRHQNDILRQQHMEMMGTNGVPGVPVEDDDVANG